MQAEIKVEQITSEIEKIYKPLYQDICYIHTKWGIFRQLYVSDKNTVDILNKSGALFFRITQELLVDDIVLSLSRLTDPSKTFKKDNLSLEQLVDAIDESKFPKLKDEASKQLENARIKCSFAREIRNKKIAHNDLTHRLQPKVSLYSKVTTTTIDDALLSIRELINKVATTFEGSTVCYEILISDNHVRKMIKRFQNAEEYWKIIRDSHNFQKS
jgi:hypothetical protein